MRITFGSSSAVASVRYEVAWCFPHQDFRRDKNSSKPAWWLDSQHDSAQAASARLKEIQLTILAHRGGAAVYEVGYDAANKAVSERVVTQCGNERPPFRADVAAAAPQLKAAFAELLGPSTRGVRRKARPRRFAAPLALGAGFALALGAAIVFAGTQWWTAPAVHPVSPSDAERARHAQGQILMPRGNSQICDRYLFDNRGGGMRATEAAPCDGSGAAQLTEQVKSFSAGWRRWGSQ